MLNNAYLIYLFNLPYFKFKELLVLFQVCKKFKENIEKNQQYQQIQKFNKNIINYLKYDVEIYNEFYYKRLIISNIFKKNYEKYFTIRNFKIKRAELIADLDDNKTLSIYLLINIHLPLEFLIFLKIYYLYPSIYIEVFPINFINKMIMLYRKIIQEDDKFLLNGIPENMLFLIPLCFSKKFQKNYNDETSINILCLINILDNDITINEPMASNQSFIILNLKLLNIEDERNYFDEIQQFLLQIHHSLKNQDPDKKMKEYYYISNITTNASNFENCIKNIIKLH